MTNLHIGGSNATPQATANDGVEVLSGGTMRVSLGVPTAPQNYSVPATNRVYSGHLSIDGTGQVIEHGGVVSYTMGQDPLPTDSIAASVTSTYGPPSVTIPGFGRTSVEAAIKMGLIRRDGDRLVDVVQGESAVAAVAEVEQAPEVDQESAAAFDPVDDKLWQEDVENLPQHSFDAVLASQIGVIAMGNSMDASVKSFGDSAGIEPALARDYVEQGTAMYTRTVGRALAPLGLQGAELAAFYEHTRSKPAKLQQCLQDLVYGRSTTAFRSWAGEYLAGRR